MIVVGNSMISYFIETFGCTANTAASELMSYLLQECGYQKTTDIEKATFAVINTCIVKAPTESKIKVRLLNLSEKLPLIITGCLPQVLHDWCKEKIPQAVLLGVDHFFDICLAAKELLSDNTVEYLTRQEKFSTETSRDRTRDLTGIIEISKGCTGECAYCIVRIAKGKLVSKSKNQILAEAHKAISEGCKELWLTAQDTASYGFDINSSLPEIVNEIANIDGEFMIRMGMMNADYALKVLPALKKILQNSKVYAFLHIPGQSGSNSILKEMKRKYTIEEFINLIKELRQTTSFTLSTDIIAGFPGETLEDHKDSIKLLTDISFDIVNISKYTDRKGTVASHSKNKLPTEIIKERSKEISSIVKEMTLQKNKQWIDWRGPALALEHENNERDTVLRNRNYKKIVVKNQTLNLGQYYNVKIIQAQKTRLIGKLL
ncbi:MAG: tRNA (N(6)-L-threonylcarbamoyladenosine(37)-C(2))-methylthiotransferase [Asgard group archaeon]|nr:tRNA (N(6)-L-threonylcarbamoyladenosine(37)-C(2))-methylthiotransferase [Asgard group archaeon]